MSWQPPNPGAPPRQYSPDGRWYWDGMRWLPVPQGGPPPMARQGQPGGVRAGSWAPTPPAPDPQPTPPTVQAPAPAPGLTPPGMYQSRRRRSYLVDVAIVLVALIVLGSVGSIAVIAIRNHQTNVPSSAPSAQVIFQMPFTKGVRSARFREVERPGGVTLTGSGVIEFAPEHAFSESLSGPGGVFEQDMETGGVAYQGITGMGYRASDTELIHFQSLGWDGAPAPGELEITAQTKVAGQRAWVLKEANTSNEWIIGEQTGDPLKVVLNGNDTYTFSGWGRAPGIQAPAAGQVSTGRYNGSTAAPVAAPAATVAVLKAQADSAAGAGDPARFRTVALEIAYTNTSSSASDFDDTPSLVSSDGVFAMATYTTLSPALQAGTGVAPGQTITGWVGFTVPRQVTTFHLLFGEQADQSQKLDYLISIGVDVPG